MGRKPLSDEPKSRRTLRIMLTDKERLLIDTKAEASGKASSTWIRDLALKVIKDDLPDSSG